MTFLVKRLLKRESYSNGQGQEDVMVQIILIIDKSSHKIGAG